MRLKEIIKEGQEIKPWKLDVQSMMLDNKGKVSFIHPELRGPAQCPFWKTLKSKIAANLKEGVDEVKVPKSFAIEVGKEYKVPLDPTYTTPMCIGPKICAHFRGVGKGAINCDFKLGVKAGPEKKVDIESTAEPVPAANKEEAPVKEEVAERGSVPAVTERTASTSAIPLVGLTDARPGNYPEDTMTESQFSRYADTDEQEQLINELENTLKELGKRIVGGTTIGKRPQTVVLDLKYQGSEIYVNASDEERGRDANVKINGVVVDPTDVEAVKKAIEPKQAID